jgi:site-specific recombinase XerD
MRAQGKSPRTVEERLRIVVHSGLDPLTADVWAIERWLGSNPAWKPSTRRAYTDALRAFFGWMHRRGLRGDNPMGQVDNVAVAAGVPHPVTTDELRALLARARTRRLRGYLLLGAYAGLRVSEIAAVAGEDIVEGHLFVTGKGRREAVLPLHPALARYAAGMPDSGWWFPAYGARADQHVTGHNVSRVVAEHMKRCGVAGSAHSLRHWFGTQLVAGGAQMRVVQESMRHANLQTTQVYTQVNDEQIGRAVAGLPMAV